MNDLDDKLRDAIIKKRKECEHHNLQFGSGDFYVICSACGTNWTKDTFWDGDNAPEESETNHSPKINARVPPLGTMPYIDVEKFYPKDEEEHG